ncbi:MAG: hypothetical protein RL748_1414 [Pseudomonadota bacterium]|jgi:hypothetical protein
MSILNAVGTGQRNWVSLLLSLLCWLPGAPAHAAAPAATTAPAASTGASSKPAKPTNPATSAPLSAPATSAKAAKPVATTTPPGAVAQALEKHLKLRLQVPAEENAAYTARLQAALVEAKLADLPSQYILLVDRNRFVQAMFIYWKTPQAQWQLLGAAPVSTGKPGQFDHFHSPLGVFAHTLENHDFRAQGTKNDKGIRGYGVKGMRVYDLGWAHSERGWGKGGPGIMRMQMHATDPVLERRMGQRASKGCIRIPGDLNFLIDHFGLIDADYEAAAQRGPRLWILRPDRQPVSTPGRYVVIVDSGLKQKPAWLSSSQAKAN